VQNGARAAAGGRARMAGDGTGLSNLKKICTARLASHRFIFSASAAAALRKALTPEPVQLFDDLYEDLAG